LLVGIARTAGGTFDAVDTSAQASTVVMDAIDTTAVTLTATPAVTEGGSIVYTASVNNAVTGSDLVIALTNGQTITIPVGASSASGAPFAVRADDAYAQGDETVAVAITGASGANFESLDTTSSVSALVRDDADTTVVTLTASSASVTEGGSIVYTAS